MKTAHVFNYKYPRLKEGLTHWEVEFVWGMTGIQASAPLGSYVYLNGDWFHMTIPTTKKMSFSVSSTPVLTQIRASLVPKEIRVMALLLT